MASSRSLMPLLVATVLVLTPLASVVATIDRVMFAPIMDLRVLMGVGPRVAKHTITDIWMSPFPSYEDMTLKN